MFIIGRSVTVRDDDIAPNAPHQSQVAESLRDEVVLEWLIYKFNNFIVPSRYFFNYLPRYYFSQFQFAQKIIHVLLFQVSYIATIRGLGSLKPHFCLLVKDIYLPLHYNIQRSRVVKQWRPRLASFPLQGSSLLTTCYSWRKPIQPGLITAVEDDDDDDLSAVEHAAFLSSLSDYETAVDTIAMPRAVDPLADHGKVICRFVIAGSIARKL